MNRVVQQSSEMIKPVKYQFKARQQTDAMPTLSHDIQRIGLMADSHGNHDLLKKCIKRLKDYEVDIIIHLGDFFDSLHAKDAIETIETIGSHHIFTVKGNNDYQVENALKNGSFTHIPAHHRKMVRSFLSSIPMRIVINNFCFAHSLPYDSIRSIYEPIDTGNTDRAERIFHDTDYSVIFSGHSHFPILFRKKSGKVSRETINSKSPIMLYSNERFIIIVGSVNEGESGVMDIAQMSYERIRA
jgi:predicted phosphodiesterase